MNNDDYLKTLININNKIIKNNKYKSFINYLKNNIFSIIAIIISIIALLK